MALTDVKVRNAKPTAKPIKLYDGGGLYLEVAPSGGRLWRLKYRFNGKEKRLALGKWPEVTLKDARSRRDEARRLLANEIDPGEHRKAARAARSIASENSFEAVAREWYAKHSPRWAPTHANKIIRRLELYIFPWIGSRPISEITAPEVLRALRRIEGLNIQETAHRAMQNCSRVFRYAVATGRADRDPCTDLRGEALAPVPKTKHHAAITDPVEVGKLLRAFDSFNGTYPVRCALRLAPLLFVRPGELRTARWADIDLDKAQWRFNVSKTKIEHLVPLSAQAVAILRELYPLTGTREHLFPGGRDPKRPMSDAAINAALRRLGYDTQTEITGHGFRAMARTILHEHLHIKPEVIEHQLAHRVPDTLGTAYNRTKFLKERYEMMQAWANYLDKLKAGAEVIPLESVR